MELFTSQEEIRRIIIIDMVKKRNSIAPLVLLWFFDGTLRWIHSAFEEGLKSMRRYALFTNISSL